MNFEKEELEVIVFFVRGHAKKVLQCVQCKHLQNFPNFLLQVTSSLWSLIGMEELEGIHGAEGGSDLEFHEIPTQGSSHISQATYIRAPSQGLPTTTTTNQIVERLTNLIRVTHQH